MFFDKNKDKKPPRTPDKKPEKPKLKDKPPDNIPVLAKKRKFEEDKSVETKVLKVLKIGKNARKVEKFESRASTGVYSKTFSLDSDIFCYSNIRRTARVATASCPT